LGILPPNLGKKMGINPPRVLKIAGIMASRKGFRAKPNSSINPRELNKECPQFPGN